MVRPCMRLVYILLFSIGYHAAMFLSDATDDFSSSSSSVNSFRYMGVLQPFGVSDPNRIHSRASIFGLPACEDIKEVHEWEVMDGGCIVENTFDGNNCLEDVTLETVASLCKTIVICVSPEYDLEYVKQRMSVCAKIIKEVAMRRKSLLDASYENCLRIYLVIPCHETNEFAHVIGENFCQNLYNSSSNENVITCTSNTFDLQNIFKSVCSGSADSIFEGSCIEFTSFVGCVWEGIIEKYSLLGSAKQLEVNHSFNADRPLEDILERWMEERIMNNKVIAHEPNDEENKGILNDGENERVDKLSQDNSYVSEVSASSDETSTDGVTFERDKIADNSVIGEEHFMESKSNEGIDSDIENIETTIAATVEEFLGDLKVLESKQEDASLDSSRPPILEFGRDSGKALTKIEKLFDHLLREHKSDTMGKYLTKQRDSIFARYVLGDSLMSFKSLFKQQISDLRDHFGEKFESKLADIVENNDDIEVRNRKITEIAAGALEGFKTAAKHTFPSALQDEAELNEIVNDLSGGMIRDLMLITEEQQDIDEEWARTVSGNYNDIDEEDEDVALEGPSQKGPTKWYKKLAVRVLVLGVNYFQGWLVLEQLRKDAAERDKNMPKFPLF